MDEPAERDAAWDWTALARCARGEARRVLREPHDVEDAVQEALLRAWRSRRRGPPIAVPEAWVARIARNEALRVAGRLGSRARHEAPERACSTVAHDGDVAICEDRLEVGRALRPLNAADRRLVLLRYLADMTQPEVARALGIPEGTVKVRLHRIRRRLADELGEAA